MCRIMFAAFVTFVYNKFIKNVYFLAIPLGVHYVRAFS
jgi:hypothetical protein